MSDKVKDIKDVAPNELLVKQLDRLLGLAKEGKIRSMLSVVGWNDDSVTHGWSIDERNSWRRMLAEILIAQHEYMTQIGLAEKDSVLFRALEDE